MKKIITPLAICFAIAIYTSPAKAACGGKILQEAETKKDTLPVKYKKLKQENARLKEELEECESKKEELEASIDDLEEKISSLESEKSDLEAQLESLPSREELKARIQSLESAQ